MSNKKYWQNFGELNQSDAFKQSTADEFKEELLPLADLDDKGLLDGKTPRRDFLIDCGGFANVFEQNHHRSRDAGRRAKHVRS